MNWESNQTSGKRTIRQRKLPEFRLQPLLPGQGCPCYCGLGWGDPRETRYSFDVSVDCCRVDEDGAPGLNVRICSPDGNHWHEYDSASKDTRGDDFGRVITSLGCAYCIRRANNKNSLCFLVRTERQSARSKCRTWLRTSDLTPHREHSCAHNQRRPVSSVPARFAD